MLKTGDSLIYYQTYCRIKSTTQLVPPDSLSLKSAKRLVETVTDKFILVKTTDSTCLLRFFNSSFHDFPNKKFTYLKLVEKPYWQFQEAHKTILSDSSLLSLAAFELALKEVTEQNFIIVHDNYPQVIINGKRISGQFLHDPKLLLKLQIPELRNK